MGPGMGSERAHQRWQWHLRGGKSRFGGLQGLQKGFPLPSPHPDALVPCLV